MFFFPSFSFFFSKRKKNTLDLSSRLDFWGDLNIVSSCFQEKGKGENIFGFDFGENETKFGIFIMDRVKGSRDIHQFSSGFVYKSTRYIYV